MRVNTVNGSDNFARVNSLAASRILRSLFLNQAARLPFVRFGRINQIKPKDVFVAAKADVKTIAVIRRIRDQSAIVQDDPIFRSVACPNIDSGCPNKSNGSE